MHTPDPFHLQELIKLSLSAPFCCCCRWRFSYLIASCTTLAGLSPSADNLGSLPIQTLAELFWFVPISSTLGYTSCWPNCTRYFGVAFFGLLRCSYNHNHNNRCPSPWHPTLLTKMHNYALWQTYKHLSQHRFWLYNLSSISPCHGWFIYCQK